jgi:hypothetical protein
MAVALTRPVFKIWRSSSRRWVLYFVSGRIGAEAVSELKRLFRWEPALDKVVLDLREVRLVDAKAVEYFEHCEDAGIRLRNCPVRPEVDRQQPGQRLALELIRALTIFRQLPKLRHPAALRLQATEGAGFRPD